MDDYRRRQSEKLRQETRKKSRRKSMIILIETALIIVLTIALIIVSCCYISLKNSTQTPDDTLSGVEGTSSGTSSVMGGTDDPASSGSSTDSVASNTSSDAASSGGNSSVDVLDEWYMVLVNPDKSVTKDYISNVDRSAIKDKYTSGADSSKYLDKRIIEPFENMCKAAANDGVTLISVSAYRSYNYQQNLYNRRVQRCMNEEGLDEEAAKKKAATIVAVPGTSEHHLGLAVDINSVETSFENTAAFRWLQKHAEEYGFIMRYAKDKQSITKIIYEPWHYRYVGVEHAKAMNDLGMCMEEYVEYLKSKG